MNKCGVGSGSVGSGGDNNSAKREKWSNWVNGVKRVLIECYCRL